MVYKIKTVTGPSKLDNLKMKALIKRTESQKFIKHDYRYIFIIAQQIIRPAPNENLT